MCVCVSMYVCIYVIAFLLACQRRKVISELIENTFNYASYLDQGILYLHFVLYTLSFTHN